MGEVDSLAHTSSRFRTLTRGVRWLGEALDDRLRQRMRKVEARYRRALEAPQNAYPEVRSYNKPNGKLTQGHT